MVTIDIPDDLYKRLEKHAKGFTTPAAVISRAVDALENGAAEHGAPPVILRAHGNDLASFEALNPPNLTHTKVVAASFDGKPVKPNNWKRLLETAIVAAYKQISDFDKVRNLAAVNMVKGKKEDEGYHYLPTVDFSVQGQDANAAWRGVMFIAQNLKLSAEVSFLWRNKEGADHPGKPGTMRYFGK
jgi:hypothetical protein